MLRALLLSITVLLLMQACGRNGNEEHDTATGEQEVAPKLWDAEGLAAARAIYEQACALCHDPGASDAPEIGNRDDWDGRSRMWVAVLAEHARQGYMDMPAQGGTRELTDKQVGAAAEYMVAVTYNELPLD